MTVLDRQGLDAIIAADPHGGVTILRHLARTISRNRRRTSNQLPDLGRPVLVTTAVSYKDMLTCH